MSQGTKNTPAKVQEAEKLENGIVGNVYVEHDFELHNGAKLTVEVLTDNEDLPLEVFSAIESGNSIVVVLGRLSPRTRHALSYLGATARDVIALSEVVQRAQDASESQEG